MYTRCFEREDEIININDYGFEWYKGNKIIKSGLVENLEETIELLQSEGFEEVL